MNKLICFIINGLFTAFFTMFLGSVVVGLFFLFTGGSVIIASVVAIILTVGLSVGATLEVKYAIREFKDEKKRQAKLA